NNIPLVLYKDEVLTTEYDMFIIKNLINLIIKVKTKEYDKKFKYYYMSIARSYLFSYQDDDIFKTFKDNSFYTNEIFLKASNISKEIDNISCYKFLEKILKEFNFYEKCLSYRNVEKTIVRTIYLKKLAKNLDNLGYNPYTFASYLEEMIESDEEIKYKLNTSSSNSVKIMNIHKSKGLEFPVCYFSGLYKKFNIKDVSERFMFDNKYGIITPYYKEGIGSLFTKSLLKENYIKEEISEKIRLFYVAVTRAKEKMIFVLPDKDEIVLNDNSRLKFRSFSDMINSVKTCFLENTKFINLENINLTKDYNLSKNIAFDFLKNETSKIVKKEIIIPSESIKENKFSKVNNELLTEETMQNMKFGTDIHYLFEISDFLNPGDNKYISNFLKHDLLKNIKDASIYKEYEFVYEKEHEIYHGIIDLMLVYKDHIDIIDYKLSNIDDDKYKLQLEGYKTYIENKTGKKVKTYLYSIEKDILEEVL
ncbi:MAG: 3'-5' exonuclease, partial [Bacilli bacterium]